MNAKTEKETRGNKRKTLDSYFKVPSKKNNKPTATDKQHLEQKIIITPNSNNVTPNSSNVSKLDPIEYRLELATIDSSWLTRLEPELTKPYFRELKRFLKQQHAAGKEVYPLAQDVYSWSRYAPLHKVKVVIIGQDPYHGPKQAHGLAFSVRPQVSIPPSLLNMFKALERDYPNEFKRPSHGYLRGWAEQGVLLLNASLTVERSKANSHAGKGWEYLTDRVIEIINQGENVVFMLWGAYAQKKGKSLDTKKHLVLKSVHPSPLSAHRGFFEAGHFRKANKYLEEHGKLPIDWSYLPAEEADPLTSEFTNTLDPLTSKIPPPPAGA
ncbi:uracil-DNA glycosylase [Coemansia reversa NRRL 1564]|uniref:Uracil-DNA glycosylase n=1 Tax=Coemansia reversa (strain ATCC 12441 / NRRL 1564) TaxID=763665 RepID=A0A2G5B3K9_COERN|nr:uracil-DNA glycosylase [Coemansia reversa NRRL 1564]|eukprot:PIA13297.1 uracil-DNA glycosylase [Coemansia reversa NRRL 1564]